MNAPTPNSKPTTFVRQPQIGCLDIVVLGIIWVMMIAMYLNSFMLLFPFFVLLLPVLNFHFGWINPKWIYPILIGVLVLCVLSPVDITFRPAPNARITFLPQVQCRDSFQRVRLLIEQGKRENVDFVVAHSGCSGPTYPRWAVVVFYPSRYTTSGGFRTTHEDAENDVRRALEVLQKDRQRPKE